ncbi:hypothetical protein V2J09_007838 [Rumex salicifolius]
MESQFMMELIGLKTVDREDPPRVLYFNPSNGEPHFGVKDGSPHLKKRLLMAWQSVRSGFVMTTMERNLRQPGSLPGYHVNMDERHITSFPYHTVRRSTGFSLEDATGLTINRDIDVHSVFAASLPSSHPSFVPQRHLEMSNRWQAPPLPDGPTKLSLGFSLLETILLRGWLSHNFCPDAYLTPLICILQHARKEVNVVLKKEAEYFGDIVIVPYMDNYDLVVCDDEHFVRVDAIVAEARKVPKGSSLYIGNINYYHKPLRHGKWAVTYEEWPEEEYPPYANGSGYILSSNIAHHIVSEFEKHKLRLFKMEDVSMGMWVEGFNSTKPVHYVHSLKYCQCGCIEDYYTAHYQSPKQMICLWNILLQLGRPLSLELVEGAGRRTMKMWEKG